MTQANQPFSYPLDPLLSLHQCELEALSLELASATRMLTQRSDAMVALRQAMNESFDALAASKTQGTKLDLSKETAMRLYTERLAADLQLVTAAWEDARRAYHATLAKAQKVHRSIMGLEKHRANMGRDHASQGLTTTTHVTDEVWRLSPTHRASSS